MLPILGVGLIFYDDGVLKTVTASLITCSNIVIMFKKNPLYMRILAYRELMFKSFKFNTTLNLWQCANLFLS